MRQAARPEFSPAMRPPGGAAAPTYRSIAFIAPAGRTPRRAERCSGFGRFFVPFDRIPPSAAEPVRRRPVGRPHGEADPDRIRMLKKILKYTRRALLAVLLLLLLLPALCYIPGIQELIRREAERQAARTLGMELSIGRIRLAFPLRLTVTETRLVERGDTLLSCERLALDVSPGPLLRRRIDIRRLQLDDTRIDYGDSLAGSSLRAAIGSFSLDGMIDLRTRAISVGSVRLAEGDAALTMRPAPKREEPPTDTAAAPWRIDIGSLRLADAAFRLRNEPGPLLLDIRLDDGRAEAARIDLGNLAVSVRSVRLDGGSYACLMPAAGHDAQHETGRAAEGPSPEARRTAGTVPEAADAPAAGPWEIRIDRIELHDNRAQYAIANHRPTAGFDPAAIAVTGFDTEIDSLRSYGAQLAVRIRSMHFAERSGFTVEELCGSLALSPDGAELTGLKIATTQSSLRADVKAGAGILALAPDTPLTADLTADVGMRDAARFVPTLDRAVLRDKRIGASLQLAGTLADIRRLHLGVTSPGHLELQADGAAKQLLDPARAELAVRLDGTLRQMDFLRALLPDTALQRRIAIPGRITLRGDGRWQQGRITASAALGVGTGRLSLSGTFDAARKEYEAVLCCDSFPLGRFLPADSLGRLDLNIEAGGRGFDPLDKTMRATLRSDLARAEYRGRDLGGISLEARLEECRLAGLLASHNKALRLAWRLDGALSQAGQRLRIAGDVASFDLAALGLTPDSIGGRFRLDASAAHSEADGLSARISFDSIRLHGPAGESDIRPTQLTFATGPAGTRSGIRSGDLSMVFDSPSPLDSLTAALARSADTLRRGLRTEGIDMRSLQPLLPRFRLLAAAGRENILNNFLRTKGASFETLEIRGGNRDSLPAALRMRIEGLTAGGVRLDTLSAGLAGNGHALDYELRIANTPPRSDSLAHTSLSGRIEGRELRALLRRQAPNEQPTRLGFAVVWSDSLIEGRILPDLGTWHVNADNRIAYGRGRRITADLELTRGDQRLALHTVPAPGFTDGVRLDIAGIDIARTLQLLPEAPPVGGTLATRVELGLSSDSLSVQGSVTAAGVTYDGARFGDVGIGASYAQGSIRQADALLTLDADTLLTARARYGGGEPLEAECTIPGLPLQRLDPLLPADLLRLAGTLHGRIRMYGEPEAPRFDGGISFAQAQFRVPMIGTTFRLAGDTVRLDGRRVAFDRFTLLAPNGRPFTIDGTVDLTDLARTTADLQLRASDFQFLDVARKQRTAVYDTGYLDLNASVRGPLDALTVRGRLALLRGTELTYVMQDSPTEIRNESQDVVTFVSFRDETQEPAPETEAAPVRIGGMDLQLEIDINDEVKAGVDLSPDGNNRIDLRGGGDLTFSMNPLGDMALSGRYLLTGGSVRYNPPVIAQKVFAIRPGSYVEWTGNPADPHFDITATETVRASVSTDGGESRPVNFDISVQVRNSLEDLAVSFGLSAPEDLTMQNQLQSLTDEQRAQQAMNLLIYNAYTGPGTTARANAENPLNAFVQKELNQWAQNSLKGVDLSFGIDSYDETDPNGARTDYSYRLSKNLFGNRFRVIIGGKFSTDTDPTENLKENMIDDISLEYVLTRRGNMFLRLFRHTGYESILEGEITETGVGFIIRKKMARLLDLFRSADRTGKKRNRHESDTH